MFRVENEVHRSVKNSFQWIQNFWFWFCGIDRYSSLWQRITESLWKNGIRWRVLHLVSWVQCDGLETIELQCKEFSFAGTVHFESAVRSGWEEEEKKEPNMGILTLAPNMAHTRIRHTNQCNSALVHYTTRQTFLPWWWKYTRTHMDLHTNE